MNELHGTAENVGDLAFDVQLGNHTIRIDAPSENLGNDTGPKPTYLLLGGIMTCTGMDLAVMLKKANVSYSSFKLGCDVIISDKFPKVFTEGHLHYYFEGDFDDSQIKIIQDSVKASKERYCSVSIMLSDSFPIAPHIHINGKEI